VPKNTEKNTDIGQDQKVGLIKRFATKRRLVILGIIILAIIAVRVVSARRSRAEVDTVSVRKGKLVESVSASGEVKATEAADLAFQTAGTISFIGVKEGEIVKRGQLLAKLDTTKINADFQRARADLRDTEATVDRVHDDLKDKGSSETLTERETRTAAETAKDKAYEAVLKAEKDLRGASIFAPFAGTVTNLEEGYTVGTNVLSTVKILSVVNPETVYFSVEVNETEVINLRQEQEVLIDLDAYPDEEIIGTVETINFGSIITSTGGTAYRVRVTLPENNSLKFRTGMNGDAKLVVSETDDVLLVNLSAVVEEDGKTFVWIVGKNKKISKVEIEVGASSVDDVEVTSGVSEGDKLILRPPSKLEEGQGVKLAP